MLIALKVMLMAAATWLTMAQPVVAQSTAGSKANPLRPIPSSTTATPLSAEDAQITLNVPIAQRFDESDVGSHQSAYTSTEGLSGRSQPATAVEPFVSSRAFDQAIKKIALATIGVLSAAVALLFLLKRTGWYRGLLRQGSMRGLEPQRQFRVLDTLKIGGKSQLQIVEADGCRFLVGINSNGIQSVVQTARKFDSDLWQACEDETTEVAEPARHDQQTE